MASLISNIIRQVPKVLSVNALRSQQVTSTSMIKNHVRMIQTGTMLNAPRVQQPAPPFKGMAAFGDDFKEISLTDFKGQYVVLFFYPLDFTFVCPTELIAFNERVEDFKKLGVQLIGVSVDSHYTHLGWMNTPRDKGGLGKLQYPLLSDLNKTIARDYNVLLENEGIALRGLFIIDPKGVLRIMQVNDLPVGRSVTETLRLVEAIKFYEEHGEVCPANWKAGDLTIKPNPKEAQEYFSAANKRN
ncbi:peroxiredoxin-2-like [Atheta coriaria]|uniref:peroxiredoxin-2-like n=1 Tax=Dalotia coriaria TaxID=877792 RepID=UPI0031F3D20D